MTKTRTMILTTVTLIACFFAFKFGDPTSTASRTGPTEESRAVRRSMTAEKRKEMRDFYGQNRKSSPFGRVQGAMVSGHPDRIGQADGLSDPSR
jgi:hypothetical protein